MLLMRDAEDADIILSSSPDSTVSVSENSSVVNNGPDTNGGRHCLTSVADQLHVGVVKVIPSLQSSHKEMLCTEHRMVAAEGRHLHGLGQGI